MAIERFAGSSGRLKFAYTDQTLEGDGGVPSDVPAFDGAGSADTVGAITKWQVEDTHDRSGNRLFTYDSPATPDGVVYPELTVGGTGYWTATVEAVVDRESVGDLYVGRVVLADLLYHRASSGGVGFGHWNCGGVIASARYVTGVNERVALLSLTIDGDGVFPTPS